MFKCEFKQEKYIDSLRIFIGVSAIVMLLLGGFWSGIILVGFLFTKDWKILDNLFKISLVIFNITTMLYIISIHILQEEISYIEKTGDFSVFDNSFNDLSRCLLILYSVFLVLSILNTILYFISNSIGYKLVKISICVVLIFVMLVSPMFIDEAMSYHSSNFDDIMPTIISYLITGFFDILLYFLFIFLYPKNYEFSQKNLSCQTIDNLANKYENDFNLLNKSCAEGRITQEQYKTERQKIINRI